jgi:cytochrome P450
MMACTPYDRERHQDPYPMLGANLARLEARVPFEELLERFLGYRMTHSRVERTCSGPSRGVPSLPVAGA